MKKRIFITLSSAVVLGVVAVASVTYFSTQKLIISADQKISANVVAFSVLDQKAKIGEAVGGEVAVNAPMRIASMDLYFQYDASALKVDRVEIADSYKDTVSANVNVSDSKIRFSSSAKGIYSGAIAKVFFVAQKSGETAVSISNDSRVTNLQGEDIILVYKKGKFLVG